MERNLSVDLLKLILAFMVVALHTAFLKETSAIASYMLGNSLFRLAVPIFLLINGYYFFNALDNRIVDWFKRVLLLYVFWMLIYSYFWLSDLELSAYSLAKQVKDILIGYHHLWYLPAMMGAGLLLYLFRFLSNRYLLVFAVSLYALGVVLQYMGNYHVMGDGVVDRVLNTFWIYRNFLFFGFPFFVIGYLLRKTQVLDQVSLPRLFLFVLAGWLLLLVEVGVNRMILPKAEGFDMFAALLLVCPLVFVVAHRTHLPDNKNIAKTLALYATAIYFIHPMLISLFELYLPLGSLMTFLVAATSLGAAYLIVSLHRKFKFIL